MMASNIFTCTPWALLLTPTTYITFRCIVVHYSFFPILVEYNSQFCVVLFLVSTITTDCRRGVLTSEVCCTRVQLEYQILFINMIYNNLNLYSSYTLLRMRTISWVLEKSNNNITLLVQVVLLYTFNNILHNVLFNKFL